MPDLNDLYRAGKLPADPWAASEPYTLPPDPREAARGEDERGLTDGAPEVVSLANAAREALALAADRREGRVAPVPIPWPAVNDALGGGWWPGLYVLCAPTGAGKTQWALQAALAAAEAGAPVLYLALEMGRDQTALRLIAHAARTAGDFVSWSDHWTGQEKRPEKVAAFEAAAGRLAALPFDLAEAPPHGWEPDSLSSSVAELRERHPDAPRSPFVVLDYLQLAGGAGRGGSSDPRERVMGAAYACRTVARDFGAVVLAVSSMSRASVGELGKDGFGPGKSRPTDWVGMGKEAGEVEYSADGVLVLGCAKEAADPGPPKAGKWTPYHLAVAKLRHGKPQWLEASFDGSSWHDGWAEQAKAKREQAKRDKTEAAAARNAAKVDAPPTVSIPTPSFAK